MPLLVARFTCRDDSGDASGLEVGKDEVGVVSLVGKQDTGLGTGLVHDRRIAFHIGDLTAAQRNCDREASSMLRRWILVERPPRERQDSGPDPLFLARRAC